MIALLGSLIFAVSIQQKGIDSPAPIESEAAHVVIKFLDAVTSGHDYSEYVSTDFSMSWMGLSGETTSEEMSTLLSPCYLGALLGSQPLESNDTAKYVWAIMVCDDGAQRMRMPLGFAVREEKIFQIELQYATPLGVTADDSDVEAN